MSNQAVCFVDMPFGKKKDPVSGVEIDFDLVFNKAIKPAIEDVELRPVRGDQEQTGGVIHLPMFARIILSDYMVADLTLGNPNVFYELGIRHMAKPCTTVPIFATTSALPFDVASVRSIPYSLEKGVLSDDAAAKLRADIAARLRTAIEQAARTDSPVYDLVRDLPAFHVPPEVEQVLNERIDQQSNFDAEIEKAKSSLSEEGRRQALAALQQGLGDISAGRRGILMKLMLAYRSVSAWNEMAALCEEFPDYLRQNPLVQQQWALALNRRNQGGDRERAERMLNEIIQRRGPDSESLGLLGRIAKDRYQAERQKNPEQPPSFVAEGHLDEAIDSYTRGFQADPRDFYPGINAVTLGIHRGTAESVAQARALIPSVKFALARNNIAKSGNYWDVATAFELACCEENWAAASPLARQALAIATREKDSFKPTTTLNNLRFLREGLARAGRPTTALDQLIQACHDAIVTLKGEARS